MKSKNSYYEAVYELTRMIPRGKVCTYGLMADFLGLGSARMVGWALNQSNRATVPVPAHRVVNRKGELSGRHHFSQPELMQELLESEGLTVDNWKVKNLANHLWQPTLTEP